MAKLSFDDALQRLNDQRTVSASEIQARALQRMVWVAEWHLPGCLSESFSVCLTKGEAIECALSMADSPRGMRSDLQRFGRSDRTSPDAWARGAITTIEKRAFHSLF